MALVLLAVAQRDGLDAPLHDVTAEAAGPVLDDHPDGDVDLGVADGSAGLRHVVEDVAFVGHGDPIQPREPAAVAERPIGMGSTPRHITSIAVIAAAGIVGLGLAGCSNGDDDAASSAATMDVEAPADGALLDADESLAAAGAAEPAPMVASDATADQAADIPTLQVPGQAIAIEARATLEADDVKAAVDRVTTTVTTRGGRVAAADVDYGRPAEDDGGDTDDGDGTRTGARATLVLEVPPGDLPAVVTALEDLGTVLSFDQLAEDVTDQLADLDTRVDNMRASVERVRALYAEAVDIDSVVRLEAELTRRETDLEVLLATQSALEDRVTMSTLTLDITSTATATTPVDDDDPGILDAARRRVGRVRRRPVRHRARARRHRRRSCSPPRAGPGRARRAPPVGRRRPAITAAEDVSAPEPDGSGRT